MARPYAPARVKGPYRELRPGGVRYRVRIEHLGQHRDHVFHSEDEAQALRRELMATLPAAAERVSLGQLIDQYFREKEQQGSAQPRTCREQRARLEGFLDGYLERAPHALTAKLADSLYQDLTRSVSARTGKPYEAATHRFILSLTKIFFKWAVRKKVLSEDPFDKVFPIGRSNRGKPQLNEAEALRYIQSGLSSFDRGDALGLAAVLLIGMGLRVSELAHRRVRDVDSAGAKLWIGGGKTRNARRYLGVPDYAQPYLARHVAGRPAEAPLFTARCGEKPVSRQVLWTTVRRICQQADIPVVCPHSLRGSWATLAVHAGLAPQEVAAALGHGSFTMTARHYAAPEAVRDANTHRLAQRVDRRGLDGKGAPGAQPLSARALLDQLPPETLAELAELLSSRAKNQA